VIVINPWFLTVFLGTAAACALTPVGALLLWRPAGLPWLVAGGLLYLVGSFGVTMVFNVPRNNALAALAPAAPEAVRWWSGYLSSWTAWNHVRLVAALAAAASFTVALWLR